MKQPLTSSTTSTRNSTKRQWTLFRTKSCTTPTPDLTPHFRRITVAGPSLDRVGVPGRILDLRIKLLLPVPVSNAARNNERPACP
ncbi:MAG TPA: siderophore-interacting protein [Arthrobacter sp.]|nr:siderophore-interacting protein [Arthrobacter sp.]